MKRAMMVVCTVAAWAGLVIAGEEARRGGPGGGRLLEGSIPEAEFRLESNGTAVVAFYSAGTQTVAATTQSAELIADAPSGKQTIAFELTNGVLVSKSALPEGDGYGVVLRITAAAGEKPQNYRFQLATHTCGGCNRPEYACTCAH